MSAFAESFIQYSMIMVILAALSVGGVFLGKFLRVRKDAKDGVTAQEKKE